MAALSPQHAAEEDTVRGSSDGATPTEPITPEDLGSRGIRDTC